MRTLSFIAACWSAAMAEQLPFMPTTQYLTPADMDYDLWKAIDNIRWDTLDYKQNKPVVDETKQPD